MSEKHSRPRIVPLRKVACKPITDPAELAALEEMVRQQRGSGESLSVRTRGGVVPGTDPSGQGKQLAELVAGWSSQGQAVFLAELFERLPSEMLRSLGEAVQGQ